MTSFITDSFTGSDGTELHTYDSAWTQHPSLTGSAREAYLYNNAVRPTTTTSPYYYYTTAPSGADYSVSFDAKKITGTANYVANSIARVSLAAVTFYRCSIYYDTSGRIQIHKFVSGTATALTSIVGFTETGTDTVKFDLSGSDLTASVNGAYVTSASDSSITAAGYCGIGFYSAATPGTTVGVHTDNFLAEEVGGLSVIPNLLTNTSTLYSPTITTGAVSVVPNLLTNSNTVYSPTVSATYAITANLLSNSNTIYSPTIGVGGVSITPNLLTNTSTVYEPVVSQEGGTQNVVPNLLTNSSTLYGPTITTGSVSVVPNLLTNTSTVYDPSVSNGFTLYANLLTNTSTLFSPTVSVGTVDIQPGLLTNSQTFYSPTVKRAGDVEEVARPTGGGSSTRTVIGKRKQKIVLLKRIEEVQDLIEQVEEVVKEEPKVKAKLRKAKKAKPQEVENTVDNAQAWIDYYLAVTEALRDQERAQQIQEALHRGTELLNAMLEQQETMQLLELDKKRNNDKLLLLMMMT